MANMITDDRSARQLARAIASDIELYNGEAVRSGADLTNEVEEGRALFETRVSPALHAVFDEEMRVQAPELRYASAGHAAGTAGVPGSFFGDEINKAAPAKEAAATTGGAATRSGLMLFALVAVAVVIYLISS